MPGCTAYLSPAAAYWLGVGFTGTQTWEIAIPFVPGVSGESFYLQRSVYVPGYNPGWLVFTNALAGTVGL